MYFVTLFNVDMHTPYPKFIGFFTSSEAMKEFAKNIESEINFLSSEKNFNYCVFEKLKSGTPPIIEKRWFYSFDYSQNIYRHITEPSKQLVNLPMLAFYNSYYKDDIKINKNK